MPKPIQINRRKLRKYKPKKSPINKTKRRELRPEERAFIAGAIFAGNASHHDMAKMMDYDRSGVSEMLNKAKAKADEGGFKVWGPILYQNETGRQRPQLITQAQKDEVVLIVTSNQEHREKESWQAKADGDFKHLPPMSISTFQNVTSCNRSLFN